jgi:murein DD-endopeptidase MepM/ murein hydrolase activator NlpD
MADVLLPSSTGQSCGRRRRPIRLVGLACLAAMMLFLIGPATGATGITPASPWQWPIAPPRVLVRPFVAPASLYGAGHRGIDLAAPAGAAVFAPADGVVHFAGVIVDRPVVSIEHPGGLISSFEPVAPTVVAGESIRRGEVIGTLRVGHCARACLHFGVRLHGEYLSPLNYLVGIPRSVLLPTRPIG